MSAAGTPPAADPPDAVATRRSGEHWRINFGTHEEHMRCKGTMFREVSDLPPRYHYAGDGYPNAPVVVEPAAD